MGKKMRRLPIWHNNNGIVVTMLESGYKHNENLRMGGNY